MRLTHLEAHELQAFADCRHRPSEPGLSREQADRHREQHEHVYSCRQCREALAEFEALYAELSVCAVNQPSLLPRNFARRTTLAIPPFAAAHSRATIRLWSGVGAAAGILVAWWLCTLNWAVLIGRAAASVTATLPAVKGWLSVSVAKAVVPTLLSLDQLLPSSHLHWGDIVLTLAQLVSDPTVIVFAVCAGIAGYLLTSVDDLILMEYISRRNN